MSLLTKSTTDDSAKKKKEPKETAAPRGRRRATASTSASVNLLSPWVLDELKVRRLRRRFVAGAIALVVAVAGAWGLLRVSIANSEKDLRADQSVGAGLTRQIAELSDVKLYVNNVRLRATSVETSMARQIAFADVMRELDRALPEGTALTTVNVLLPPDEATTDPADLGAVAENPLCPGPDPFGSVTVVGCVTLTGTADSRADISDLVQALGLSDLFIEPFITGTTQAGGADSEEAGVIEFDGTLGLSETTFTGRFADVDGSDAPAEDASTTTTKKTGKKGSR